MTQKAINFKQVQILYLAMLAGQVMIGAVFFFMMQNQELPSIVETPYNIIIPAAVIVGIIASQFLHRKQNVNLPISASPIEKLEHYRRWGIMKWAAAEGGNLLSLCLTFIFGNVTTYVWFGVGVVMFSFLRPSIDKFTTDYNLSQTEREKLNG